MEQILFVSPTFLAFLFSLEGCSSAQAGQSEETNPYELGTVQRAGWQDGWQECWDALRAA